MSVATSAPLARRQSGGLRQHQVDLLISVFLVAVVCVALLWFWRFGPPNDVDMVIGVYRAFELNESWRTGVLYPRIGPDLNFGYGSPLFEYYPPLVSYLIVFSHWLGLGWVEAMKATCTGLLIVGGLGVYLFARSLYGHRDAALLSALAFLLAPYLLDAITNRSASAEMLAWVLLPWLFWSLHNLFYADRRGGWIFTTSIFFALTTLAHNVVILASLPVLFLYSVLCAWRLRQPRRLFAATGALLLGLALGAFYWLPALVEGPHSRTDVHVIASFQPWQQLTALNGLVQERLAAIYWGPVDKRLALWQALIAGLSLFALPTQPRKLRPVLVCFGAMLLGALALQTTASAWFWIHVPWARFFQFSWRWLGLASLCVAVLAGSLLMSNLLRGRGVRYLGLSACAVLVLFGSLRDIRPPANLVGRPTRSQDIGKEHLFELGRSYYPLFSDYLPEVVQVDPPSLATSRPPQETPLPPLATLPAVRVLRERFTEIVLQVSAETPFTLRFHRIYTPGHQVYVSGRPTPTLPDGPFGLVSAVLPAGSYPVTLRYELTSVHNVARAVSWLALAAVCAGGLWLGRRRRRVLASALVLVISLIVFAYEHVDLSQAPRRPVARAITFEGNLQLLGYDIPKGPWHPGDTIPVRLYWFAGRTPAIDYKIFLHLVKPDDSDRVAQSDRQPMLGASPMTRWRPGEMVVDEQHLSLGQDVAPGRYDLLVGLYHPETVQNLKILTAPLIWPGDRALLTTVELAPF